MRSNTLGPLTVCLLFLLASSCQRQGSGPETATIPADTLKSLQSKARDARLARLEAETLALDMELARVRMQRASELMKMSQEAADKEFLAVCARAGIPQNEAANYEASENEKGELILRRKPSNQP